MIRRILVPVMALGALLISGTPAHAAGVPVLVVGGTFEQQNQLNTLQTNLQNAGFTVFTMALPGVFPGTQDIAVSSQAVANKANQVLQQTGASQLSVVGHSQGGLELRYYIKNLGGSSQVLRYVSLGTPQHGTTQANAGQGGFCTACAQMAPGSTFLNNLNNPTDVPGPVNYTALGTTKDTVVTPAPQASFLQNGGTNASVQQFCPNDNSSHVGLLSDAPTAGLVISALRGGPLSTTC